MQGQHEHRQHVEQRPQADKEKHVGDGAERVLVTLMGPALGVALFLAADDGDVKLAFEKRHREADIDRRTLPRGIFHGFVDVFLLFARQGVHHPFGHPKLSRPA